MLLLIRFIIITLIDTSKLELAERNYYNSNSEYYRHKGWFSCDEQCAMYKLAMEEDYKIVQDLTRAQEQSVR